MGRLAEAPTGGRIDGRSADYVPFGTRGIAAYADGTQCPELARANGSRQVEGSTAIVERNMHCPRGHTFTAYGPATPPGPRSAPTVNELNTSPAITNHRAASGNSQYAIGRPPLSRALNMLEEEGSHLQEARRNH